MWIGLRLVSHLAKYSTFIYLLKFRRFLYVQPSKSNEETKSRTLLFWQHSHYILFFNILHGFVVVTILFINYSIYLKFYFIILIMIETILHQERGPRGPISLSKVQKSL